MMIASAQHIANICKKPTLCGLCGNVKAEGRLIIETRVSLNPIFYFCKPCAIELANDILNVALRRHVDLRVIEGVDQC